MRTVTKIAAAVVFTLMVAGTALAGYKASSQVYVDVPNKVAFGDVGAARNSSDSTQQIGCYTWAYSSGAATAYCYAQDASNHVLACRTTASALVQVVHGMTGDSHVWFMAAADGTCAEIDITNMSWSAPKNP